MNLEGTEPEAGNRCKSYTDYDIEWTQLTLMLGIGQSL